MPAIKGKLHTREHNIKIGLSCIGKKHSIETIKKIRLGNLGKLVSSETKEKMSNSLKMEKHPKWKGGIGAKTRIKLAPRAKPELCEVCGAIGSDLKRGLCYDHDHTTGNFRGWLCTRCNLALGMVKDNTETLLALVDYIRQSKK